MKFKKFTICILLIFLVFINICNFSYANNLNIYSEAVILMEASTGKILFSKNKNESKYPASTTKILTAILAIEKCQLDEKVTASYDAVMSIPSGYSNAAIQVGESLTVNELLQVFLVHSANEAGYILAEHISGSVDEFAKLMNQKAKEIGCENTNFTNPSGIHDKNHYTTAYDLCLIAKYCMENNTFRNIVSMTSCTIAPTDKYEQRYFLNTNDLLNKSSSYYNPNIIGIKTGYTSQAKNCLISGYSKNGIELISVVLGAPQSTDNGKSAKYTDTMTLFNFGIENFSKKIIAEKSSVIKSIEIENANPDNNYLDLMIENEVSAIVSNSVDISSILPDIKLKENLVAPISQNSIVGTVTYIIDDTNYTENLLAGNSVEIAPKNFTNILKLLFAFILLIIVFKLMYGNKSKKKSKKKKKFIKRKGKDYIGKIKY